MSTSKPMFTFTSDNIQHRVCAKCLAPMVFTRTKPARLGYDLRTYECVKCHNTETATTETAAHKWCDSGLLPPT